MKQISILILILSITLFSASSCKKRRYAKMEIERIKKFDGNPGNLKLYYHEPVNATSGMPMVVVLHGCSQSALSAAKLTDWNKLADEYGFYILYPEQKTVNNVSSCFNWFNEKDARLGKGECASIASMVWEMQDEFGIDENRTYVTGMSAGAGMTMALISCYPELFQGAAALAGGPFGISGGKESSEAILGKVDKTPNEWGDIVRSARNNSIQIEEYPDLIVMHGKDDNVVNFRNAGEILEQWSNVLDISISSPQLTNLSSDILLKTYVNDQGEERIWLYEIDNMGHQLPTDPGDGLEQGGGTGTFAKDIDFFSSYWIAKHWGLIP